jgi:hypothetical protein
MLKRRSRLSPPGGRAFDALVDELPSWWVAVAYRTDVVDWAGLEQSEEGRLWRATEDVWVRVEPERRLAFQRELVLERGALVWVLGRKRTARRCLGQEPDGNRRAAGADNVVVSPWYEGHAVVIPFAEFSKRLHRVADEASPGKPAG